MSMVSDLEKLGNSKEEAERLVMLYQKNGDLITLKQYIERMTKIQAIAKT